MSRQLTLFSFAKKARPENTTKMVKSVLHDIAMKVVDTERKKKKNTSDLSMTKDKLELRPKDEKFFSWNTPGGVPSPSGKKTILDSHRCRKGDFYVLGMPEIS